DGKFVLDFRGAWETPCETAKLDGLRFHDLRRSAVRNQVRRGVPERVAMQSSGHRIRSIFDHYNIVSEADLAEAARKIGQGTSVLLENGYNFDRVTPSQKAEQVRSC